MKLLKKLIPVITAICLCSENYCITNGVTYYLKGDITNDNSVDIFDTIYTQQFLTGHVTANGYTAERLDFNHDYIISVQDRIGLSQFNMSSQTPSTAQYLDPTALPVKSYRTYYVFDPITGNKISSKTYTLGTLYDTTNSSPETILGIDNRIAETSSGLSGVINVQTALGESGGTAFVIDSHTMLTAAHLLKQGTKARGGLQFKAFNGSSTPSSLSITPVEYHIPSIYMTSTSNVEKCKYDYAIVTVAENLEDYINFDLGVPRINIESNIVHTLYVTGYGGEGEGVNSSLIDIKSTGSGLLMSPPSNYDEFEICYSTDAAPGNSGSPAYIINSDNSKTVIGIHVRGENTVSKGDLLPHLGRNSATRITPDILAFVYNNDHLITDDMID